VAAAATPAATSREHQQMSFILMTHCCQQLSIPCRKPVPFKTRLLIRLQITAAPPHPCQHVPHFSAGVVNM
jgi:hypothetical protein